MSMRKELFAGATAAATGFFSLAEGEVGRVVMKGLASGDTVDVQVSDINGTTWEDAYDANGQIQFEYQVCNTLMFVGPGDWKLDKGSTSGTVAAYIVQGTTKG